MNKPTIFIVDDDEAVRTSLALLLETHGFKVASYDGAEALLADCLPTWQGCALLDVHLKGLDGLMLQGELQRRGVKLPIIFLTGQGDIPMTVRAMKAGAREFLTKPVSGEQLIPLIHAALAEDRQAHRREQEGQAKRELLARLSQRESEVLQLVLAGHANKDIARLLAISHRTVEVHRSHILAKTGVGTMLELAHLMAREEAPSAPR
jgi:FixJ family two-component response regulator